MTRLFEFNDKIYDANTIVYQSSGSYMPETADLPYKGAQGRLTKENIEWKVKTYKAEVKALKKMLKKAKPIEKVETPRIQEMQGIIVHMMCEMIKKEGRKNV